MRKISLKQEIEKQLLPRLKFLGGLIIAFGFGVFLYGMLATIEPTDYSSTQAALEQASLKEIETAGLAEPEIPQLRREIIYLGTLFFFFIGTACLYFAWRRDVKLKQQ